MAYPRSPYDKEGGLVFFPRMLDKIRLQAKGELPEDYIPPMTRGFNAACCRFLGVEYEELVAKVNEGLIDADVLQWCFEQGGTKSDFEITLWNSFVIKKGWRDEDPGTLERLKGFKQAAGLEHRDDLLTVFDFIEVDEKRKS